MTDEFFDTSFPQTDQQALEAHAQKTGCVVMTLHDEQTLREAIIQIEEERQKKSKELQRLTKQRNRFARLCSLILLVAGAEMWLRPASQEGMENESATKTPHQPDSNSPLPLKAYGTLDQPWPMKITEAQASSAPNAFTTRELEEEMQSMNSTLRGLLDLQSRLAILRENKEMPEDMYKYVTNCIERMTKDVESLRDRRPLTYKDTLYMHQINNLFLGNLGPRLYVREPAQLLPELRKWCIERDVENLVPWSAQTRAIMNSNIPRFGLRCEDLQHVESLDDLKCLETEIYTLMQHVAHIASEMLRESIKPDPSHPWITQPEVGEKIMDHLKTAERACAERLAAVRRQ